MQARLFLLLFFGNVKKVKAFNSLNILPHPKAGVVDGDQS
ncbi:hypothetical protein P278_15340 [Zhouia amylolytica AD3]|uniref:Uncharacterized protein n=1 Tax=Zhouia amylolytica AD3 TaxID=1286632 RepID=W2UR82_9FLAO|nr:hypothetical protein P278_15340 [Zhouia amylolytica AD3]